MFDSIKNIRTLRKHVASLERVDRKFLSANSDIKILISPRKLYFINSSKKLEILFDSEDSRKALVKLHVFPYLSMSLDPTGNIMRKNQHYTINELGFDFIGKSVAFTLNKDKEGINNIIYHGKVLRNGYMCYYLEYENKNFGYMSYVTGEKETATSIALKLGVNDYLLRDKNDLLNDFGYLKKGRKLLVPNLYCKKAILYIDEKLALPVSLSLYDDTGLFESYDYTNIEVNKPFKSEDFSRTNKDYGF